jgi:hypothetical protein
MNKHHKLLIAWFIISGLIVFTAVRQIQVAAASQNQARQPLPPPVKTRHAIRPAVLPWSGDPVADYVARCEKGMTDREIRWMLEDFRNAGLDQVAFNEQSTDEALLAYRAAQNRWYRETLIDGLRLNREQSDQVAKRLIERLDQLKAAFKRNREEDGTGQRSAFASSRIDLIFSPYWLMGAEDHEVPNYSTFLPWDLCSLTAQQEKITWKKEYLEVAESDSSPEFSDHSLFKHTRPMDSAAGLHEIWLIADAVFPLLKSQTIAPEQANAVTSREAMLANLRQLHQAQLKIILLVVPTLAEEIQIALDSSDH